MGKSELEIMDMEKILQSREDEETLLQRLSTYTVESRMKITTSIQDYIAKHKEYINKRELNIETIGQLHTKSKDIELQLENILLQQKVIDKKISNSIKAEDKLKEEIEEEKSKKVSLTLDMVDLQQELDEHKRTKKQQWSAIKKASSVFKENLNMHIGFKTMEDYDCITVTFFLNENPDKDNYYIILSNYHNTNWRVDQIMPMLKDEELNKLNLHLSTDYDLQQVTTFISQIRNIFAKYYFKHKNW